MPTAERFTFYYSILHMIIGIGFIVVEIYGIHETGDSTAILGGLGFWMIISGIMGIRKNMWGWLIHLPIFIIITMLGFGNLMGLVGILKDFSPESVSSIPVHMLVIAWWILESIYLGSRVSQTREKWIPRR